jgi:hypothetical protein
VLSSRVADFNSILFIILFQATEDELQDFHSDDYIRALKTAHSSLTARSGVGCDGLLELEEFGLLAPHNPFCTLLFLNHFAIFKSF